MPELPEVETVKRGLEKLIVGKVIDSITYDWPKGFPNSENDINNFLVGAEVVAVKRRAKVLIINLSSDYSLVCHLKMTGQIVYIDSDKKRFGAGHPNDSLINKMPDRSTRVVFTLKDGSRIFFNDQRKFGWIKLMPTSQIENLAFMQKVGPEPLSQEFTEKEFLERLKKRSNTSIKAAILDQTVLAGVGNIYADESLWGAKIFPGEKVRDVSDTKLKKLRKEIINVLVLSIEKGGSTDRNYVDAEGKKGMYLDFAKVFRREGQNCPRCDNIILKTRVAGRGTHYCPVCQLTVQ